VAAGPVIRQGGDFFGRTVNLASRIADHARGGQVLVSEPVVAVTSVAGVRFAGLGAIELPGLTSPIRLFEALRRVRVPRLDYKARHAVDCGVTEWL
jgi:adenylate cyclase